MERNDYIKGTRLRLTPGGIVLASTAALLISGLPAEGQSYSIDWHGPTSNAVLGGDGAVWTPIGPGNFAPPQAQLAAPAAGLGIQPSPQGTYEMDALSFGIDAALLDPSIITFLPVQQQWSFSVDEFAIGRPGVPGPSVTTEGAFGAREASADIFLTKIPRASFPAGGGLPIGPPANNAGIFDGNGGLTPFPAQGLNLLEPNPPAGGSPFDQGDNVDAWDLDHVPALGIPGTPINPPAYFSLDARFADPIEGFNANTGTALANGFVGGDVLVQTVNGGGPPSLYASAFQLGLDLFGTDTDDLDALVLWENGDGVYQPTQGPFSWSIGNTDMLLFSVRRGSAIIGQIDPLQGLPIEEGDVLVPLGPGSLPGVFIPAEALGLATLRSGFVGFNHGDDLNALDVQEIAIPEPASLMLMITGGMALGLRSRGRLST